MKQFIKDLKAGDIVEAPFRLRDFEISQTKIGDTFARMTLRDATGDAEAKWFQITKRSSDVLETVDYVLVYGKVDLRNGRVQIKINNAEPYNPTDDLSDFVPVSFIPVDILMERLDNYIARVKQPFLSNLLVKLFQEDEYLRNDYSDFPASIKNHHLYLHGLLQHSLEIVDMALNDARMMKEWNIAEVNEDVLICGSLLHDIGKTREYIRRGPDFTYHHLNSLLGHIPLGVDIIMEKIAMIPDFPTELEVLMKHIILSHHGKREWGSPVTPYTLEAELIHLADHKSATLQQWKTAMEQEPAKGEAFVRTDKLSGEIRYGGRNIFGQHHYFNDIFEDNYGA